MSDVLEKSEALENTALSDCVFGKPWKNSDVVLIVEDKKIHVHSTILSFASPVFEQMITKSENKEIQINETSYENIIIVLKNLYPQHEADLKLLYINELDELMMFCYKWQIDGVKQKIGNLTSTLANELVNRNGRYSDFNIQGLFFNQKKYMNCIMQLIKFTDKYQFEDTSKHIIKHTMQHWDIQKVESYGKEWDIVDKCRVRMMINVIEKDLETIGDSLGPDQRTAHDALSRISSMHEYISSYEFKPDHIYTPMKYFEELTIRPAFGFYQERC